MSDPNSDSTRLIVEGFFTNPTESTADFKVERVAYDGSENFQELSPDEPNLIEGIPRESFEDDIPTAGFD